MTAPDSEKPHAPDQPAPRPKRHWLRRTGWTLLILFGLLVIFHRPILIATIHLVAVKVAAKQHIKLALKVEGTVLTNLSLKNLSALPDGTGPSPVEKISIDEITVRYSIPSLIRHGVSEVLQSYALHNADIEVKPIAGTKQQKHDLASTLHDIIQQPALFSDRVDVQNLNLVAHTPDGEFALKGVSIFLDPIQPGSLEIQKLQIPKIRTWENLHATATYAKRDLILRGLQIDPEIVVEQVELDASGRAEGINRLALDGKLFGGSAQFSMLMRETGGKHKNDAKKAEVKIDSQITALSLEKLSSYFGASAPAIGSINSATMTLTGDPNVPAGWNGVMNAGVGPMHFGATTIDSSSVRLDISKGWMVLNAALNSGKNQITLQSQAALPETADDFSKTNLDGRFDIAADELSRFAAQISQGAVSGGGTFSLRNQLFTVALDVTAKDVAAENFGTANADVKLDATKKLESPKPQGQQQTPQQAKEESEPPFVGLQIRMNATFTGIHAANYALDSGAVKLSIDNEKVRLESVDLQRAEAAITASGNATLPRDMKSWDTMPADAKFNVAIPSLAAFNIEPDLNAPNGRIEASGELSNRATGYNGKISADVTEITLRDFAAQKLALDMTIAQSVATIDTLSFALNETDGFSGNGHVGLKKPFDYDAALEAHIRDLSKFNALAPDVKGGFAGALALNWTGNGNIDQLQNTGNLQLKLSNGKAAEVSAINAEIAGNYSPETIDVPTFRINTSKGDIALAIALQNTLLQIRDIAVKLGGKPILTGSVSLPLDLRTPKQPETIIPINGPVSVALKTSEINLDSLPTLEGAAPATPKSNASAPARTTGKTAQRTGPKTKASQELRPPAPVGSPVRGIVTATFEAGGTIDDLDARLQLAGHNLQAKATPKLAPASLDFDAHLIADELSVKGRIQQPGISPIEIAGTLPLPIQQIVKQKKIDEQSPVELSIRIPRSSVAFVSQVVPAIRFAEGNMNLAVDLGGTLAQPVFSGSALLDIPAVRFTNQDLPAINSFHGDVRFAGNELTFNRFSTDLAGGTVNLGGRVTIPKLTDFQSAQFDLRLTSQNALLLRNESVTVRADADIRVTGPLAAANVAGIIGITHSKFFREIEILPIELPGRPAPRPPTVAKSPSIDTPPLRDWTFNIAIKTKDPFAIRGNLANGSAIVDMSLVGNGKTPALDGMVRIENFVASLPFSKLQVTNGYVYFSRDEPFVPKLDIQADSSMRDYNIHAYIYGTADDPKTIFSSEPPLPQEDIIALLATGATSSELGSGDALAGRAAVLLFQRLYRKVFKAKEPSENESFLSRVNVDVGGVDPRTGQQEVSTRFRLGENLYLVGDLDVGGNIRGQVKYLLRFR